jgi:RNA-directed DNA polymerase
VGVARGEAVREPASDEACGPPCEHPGTGSAKQLADTGCLLEAVLTRQNLQSAWKRVKANKGAAGVEGLDIEQTAEVLRHQWPDIRQALLHGHYRPSPVRKVMIPKPDGSQRELGIPTVVDWLIQQALLQVLPILKSAHHDPQKIGPSLLWFLTLGWVETIALEPPAALSSCKQLAACRGGISMRPNQS